MNPLDFLFDKTVVFFVANTIYVISYMLTSMFWLRLLAVVAAASTMPYFYFQVEPLWSALFWQSMFLLVNLVNLVILVIASRPPRMEPWQEDVHRSIFSDLKPSELMPLLKRARQLEFNESKQILFEGQTNSNLYLVLAGRCEIRHGDHFVGYAGRHHFLGEMSMVSGEAASADVTVESGSVIIVWSQEDLDSLYRKNGLFKAYVFQKCGAGMAEKLRQMTRKQGELYEAVSA